MVDEPQQPDRWWSDRRVLVTGGAGFLGSAVVRTLLQRGAGATAIIVPRKTACDLTDPSAAHRLLEQSRPHVVIHCAGVVGGLQANRDRPGEMFHANAAMGMNIVEACRRRRELGGARGAGGGGGPEVVVAVGSMTSYPAAAAQPYHEDSLGSGLPDADIAAHGFAKLAVWRMMEAYRRQYGLPCAYVVPTNLYGPGDNIDDVRNAHVAGSLLKRFADAVRDGAAEVVCWGTGSPKREFLYVDDAAEAVVRAAERVRTPEPINLGPGTAGEVSIRELAEMIAEIVGYRGRIVWDASRPDGQPRRALDASRARERLGWSAAMPLREGLRRTAEWYRGRAGPTAKA